MSPFNKIFGIFAFILSVFWVSSCCKKDFGLISKIERSATDEIDLFLIPEKYNILESSWISKNTKSNFRKKDLVRYLAEHGRYISDLQSNPSLEFSEKEGVVTMRVGRTSHSTDYSYDKQIPILFYGDKWFQKGVYSEKIPQQKIAPTLAKIINTPKPNGAKESELSQILKESSELPEIIVTIVIDQGGQQLYKAHPNSYPNIKSIMARSAYFPNAEVGHLDAHTAVGHAAIGTGAYPRENGVVGNTFYTLENGKFHQSEIYSHDETNVNISDLRTETLADVADLYFKNQLEVISQAYALRASIGMGGHGFGQLSGTDKDYVYWLDAHDCKWKSDVRYYSYPEFANEFSPCENFILNYPNGWKDIHNFRKEDSKKYWSQIMATPKEVELEAGLFKKMIEEKIIKKGKASDNLPDLAYMTIKATDAAGHYFGWESLEAENTFQEADKQVGLILEFLKSNFSDRFVFVLTADHGCAPLPEISGGERYLIEDFYKEVNSLLGSKNTLGESLIKTMTVGQVGLNREVMNKYGISEGQIISKILKIQSNGKRFFKQVIRKNAELRR
ncbi:MAG: alkaline phosphatase family protein [Leptospiraceae bacterium]|nr:alkaline phosphatase family protein [Leptospiraceae bacterium]MCK6380954.1 alkaline phosphatase family protein [Leptospiraceae bacterium]NUM40951.1 alkaline phosphatase family protein [Leptospiraceae bacterium]